MLLNFLRFSEVNFHILLFHINFRILLFHIFTFYTITHFTSQVRLFFVEKKGTSNFGIQKRDGERIRKSLTFVIRQISSTMFGKIISKPLKTQVTLG